MAIVVGTNSYATEAELTTYATDRGVIIAGDTAVLLIKAMDFLEVQQYKGYKTDANQVLQFPRVISSDYDYLTVPTDIKTAQLVAALLIDSGESLLPTLGKTAIREKVDVLEVQYSDRASDTKVFSQLSALLRPFLLAIGLRAERV